MSSSDFDADRPPEVPRRRRREGEVDTGRRRADPHSMVPEADFRSYYGQPIVKPAPWKHEIPAYFFVGGVAGASGLIGVWAHTVGLKELRRNARYTAIAGTAVSAGLLVADLGHPERFLNMMRTVKLTSPMSVGAWILSGFGASSGIAAASELAGALGMRQWLEYDDIRGAIGLAVKMAGAAGSVLSAAFAAPLVAYTAVLLSDTATPTWHEAYRELPFVFVFSANAAGAGMQMILTSPSQTHAVRTVAVTCAAIETVAFLKMQKRLGMLAEPLHHGHAGKLVTASKVLTIGGAVGAALFGRNRVGAVLSGLALLAGSACTRFGVFEAGVESTKDPKYTIVPQRERLAARQAEQGTARDITTVPQPDEHDEIRPS